MVKDLQLGQRYREEFLVKNLSLGTTKFNKPMARFELWDSTGFIPAVTFISEDQFPKDGQVQMVTGMFEEYQGNRQMKVSTIDPRVSPKESDELFVVVSTFPTQELWDKICKVVSEMKCKDIQAVAADLLFKQGYEEGFKTSPAATNIHHAFVGGLLEHTAQMCETAEKLFELPYYADKLNKDLCMFGVLVHDMCKICEYKQTAGFKKTVQGILVPHIPMMGAMIFETANKLGVPEVIRDHMIHVVLAHHGKLEYGSPVVPATPEAGFVHYIDMLHANIFGWVQKIEASPQSENIKHFENTLVTQRFDTILKACEEAEKDITGF